MVEPFKVGDMVRIVDEHYVKTKGLRGNITKQRPRWSVRRHRIDRVDGKPPTMPTYILDDKTERFTHDQLLLANDVETTKDAVTAKERTYFVDKDDGDRVWYSSFVLPERSSARRA